MHTYLDWGTSCILNIGFGIGPGQSRIRLGHSRVGPGPSHEGLGQGWVKQGGDRADLGRVRVELCKVWVEQGGDRVELGRVRVELGRARRGQSRAWQGNVCVG